MNNRDQIDTAIRRLADALAEGRLTINPLDDGSGVVLDLDREQMMTMNRTGISIVQGIAEGLCNADQLVEHITRQFDVGPDKARADIEHFVLDTADLL